MALQNHGFKMCIKISLPKCPPMFLPSAYLQNFIPPNLAVDKEHFPFRTSTTVGTYLVRGNFHLTDDGHDVFAHHLEAMFANTPRRVDNEHDVSATVAICKSSQNLKYCINAKFRSLQATY